jgi:tRNA threonylcarbamoyl adenosine modification protein (Sua5/YciO/YrdC/YwlC family)
VHESVPVDDARALDAAERALRGGRAIVLPTDTVYGLAALPDSAPAMDELYALKDRPPSMPIAVLVASADQAIALAAGVPAPAEKLMAAFWPGPLTLVLATRDGDRGDGGDGHGGGERSGRPTVGVRCPDHEFVRALARRVGPLAVTSANRHGQPTPPGADEAARSLSGPVALVVDGGPCEGIASTVVDTTDPALPLLREGSIRREQVVDAALR